MFEHVKELNIPPLPSFIFSRPLKIINASRSDNIFVIIKNIKEVRAIPKAQK